MNTTPSEEELISALQSFAAEVDSVPTVREMREDGPYSPYYYKELFGSWHDALRAAEIQPTHGITPEVDRDELLENLQEVAKITDRPPRRRDIDEHGKYDYTLYDEEFDSFIHALEQVGIKPTEKQYRFSSVETPEELQGSANIEFLRENGPTPSSELPQDRSMKDRELGMWKFHITSGAVKPSDDILYLHGEHSPELVIRRFFEHNPHVLEYRDPHGIKIAIKNHQSSWKEIGREIVDELVESGLPESTFENLLVVRVHNKDSLRFCFDRSVSTPVNTSELPIGEEYQQGTRPIWGFSKEHDNIWQTVSENDGILFSTQPGVFTHYVPVAKLFEHRDVMTELWVEYEDGIRSGGIETPWPYVVLGAEVREVTIREEELEQEITTDCNQEPIRLLEKEDLKPLLNSYGNFQAYLRERNQSPDAPPSSPTLTEDSSTSDVISYLFEITKENLPPNGEDPELEQVKQMVRAEAFRQGICEIYNRCAICGEEFESPEGTPDLEAAHILPKSENGPDVLQNGLALCSQHHWAFDNGWFEIGENYEIKIREFPDLRGYDELTEYDGKQLYLPSETHLQPHLEYLQQRNQIHDPSGST